MLRLSEPPADLAEFLTLTRLDRRLLGLYLEALTVPSVPDFCALEVFIRRGGFKSRLRHLVGFERQDDGPA
ncbi:MAG: hypothetical protein KGR26_09385, partial [Cyanobacteria bacterium REEB65]|nr:hypothetical protein [Cyanobacteria bacterium REEB65]